LTVADLSTDEGRSRPPGILRVLVVFHETHTLGASTSVLRVVHELGRVGWSVSGWVPGAGPLLDEARHALVSVDGAARPLAFSRKGWRERPGGVARVRATPAYLRAFYDALLRVRPQVVHANTLLALPEALVARRCGLPVVLHVHELPPRTPKRTATARAAAATADVLIPVSDAVRRMLEPHAGRTPLVTVRNGVPFVPESPRRPGAFTVGTVGTVSRTKGTDVFLAAAAKALAQRPEIRFEHVGAHDLHRDDGFDDQLAAARALLPPDTVRLLGPMPAAEKLRDWDVFVSPARREAFPLSTLEAMAHGVPVVATAVGGVLEQITNGRNGLLVPSTDAAALADAIVRLHDDVALRDRLGAAARTRVRSTFTLAAQASGMHRAYLVALNRRFGPPRVRKRAAAAT
jgi:glycosyltransferase involved in cell wall biosynthesis